MRTNYFKLFLSAVVMALVVVACGDKDGKMAMEDDGPHGLILANMDTTVSPKNDFYNYVNGTWMKNTEIPDDQVRWGGFMVLRKSTDKDVLEILANAKESDKYTPDTDQAKAMMIFESELDTVARDARGIEPLQPILDKIAAVSSVEDFQKLMTQEAVTVSQPFFGFAAFSNPSNSAINSGYVIPGGLGLPDRDYYTNSDEASKTIRGQYTDHITRMLQFLGDSEEEARAQAETILAFETRLAEPRLDKVARRDIKTIRLWIDQGAKNN